MLRRASREGRTTWPGGKAAGMMCMALALAGPQWFWRAIHTMMYDPEGIVPGIVLIGLCGFVGLMLVWIAVSLVYLSGLRRVLEAREAAVLEAQEGLVSALRSWQAALSEVRPREWRESTTALERALEEVAVGAGGKGAAEMVREIRHLLEEEKERVSRAAATLPARWVERMSEVEGALRWVEASLADYRAASGDAAFACTRVPLSLMAAAIGLRSRM